MKKVIILAFVCLLAVSAVAGEKSLTFASPTTLNGKAIAPGDYKVSYEIKGQTAEVKILQNGKTVATATGQVIDQKEAATHTAVVNQKNADGSNTVVEFQFAKEKQAIRISSEGTAVGK